MPDAAAYHQPVGAVVPLPCLGSGGAVILMATCELCGRDARLVHALVEGSELLVCRDCGSFGTAVRQARPRAEQPPAMPTALPPELEEPSMGLVQDFAQRVKAAREQRGLTQEQFAQSLQEKASVLRKIEAGTLEPPIPLARKLEKALSLTLVVPVQKESAPLRGKGDGLTIGDVFRRK